MISTRKSADISLNVFCDLSAKAGNFFFRNMPIATGTAMMNNTVTIVLKRGSISDPPSGIK
ncbi:hypothetical protein D9M70_575140 [compost metagenome]